MSFFSDVGLVGSGVQDVLTRAEAARNAEADRAWLTQERARKSESEQAALDDARRQRAFADEVRSIIPQYLAGGDNAIQAQPATPGVQLDPRQQEGGDLSTPAQPAQPAQDNISGLYQAIQEAALRNGRLSDYEAMKKRLDAYKSEGVLDFIAKARQGAPESTLLDTFNQSGKVKLAALQKVDDGQYVGQTTDGQKVDLNLDRMTESLLGPKDYLAHSDRTDRTAATLDARKMAIDASEARNQGLDALRNANTALAEARLAKLTSGDGAGSRTQGNWNVFDSQVRAHARDYVTELDPDTGKYVTDRKAALKLASMASALARKDPTLSAAEAVEAASQKLDSMRSVQQGAQSQAETEAATLSFSTPAKQKAWVDGRAAALTRMRESAPAGAAAPVQAAPPAPQPAPAAPDAPAATPSDVAKPATQADYNALPKGSRYVNPKDGKVYVKN